jgi:hypothetical protein
MPTQTYTDNSRGKVVIPKRTIRYAHNPNALKTEKKIATHIRLVKIL